MTLETIYALSSGLPPAAIAIVRVSGSRAFIAAQAMTGDLPSAREASLRAVRHPITGEDLDRAILLIFPRSGSVTGEDLVELHLHGGRAIVSAVLDALSTIDGLRPALPGEFTRRSFEHGRIDLAEAEGLADLLAAETQSQRRAALALAEGSLSRQVEAWQEQLLQLAAALEARLDFADEDDVASDLPMGWSASLTRLIEHVAVALAGPSIERLRDGVRVVIAGPPNAGKSTLLNRLVGRAAAITSATAGTTRDVIEAATAIQGVPYLLVDAAGLRETGDDVEQAGIVLAEKQIAAADILLWLGRRNECPRSGDALVIASKLDVRTDSDVAEADFHVSAITGDGIDELVARLTHLSRDMLPREGQFAINRRHREAITETLNHLRSVRTERDDLIQAEMLRLARASLDRITGRAGLEDMLDRLFGSFCIGK